MQEQFSHSEKIHQTDRGLYIGDLVYGANDGIITTFAVISGAAGASLSPNLVIILGLASLVADGISMGLSNYLAIRSRLDYQKQERKREEFEVEKFPDKERAEVLVILKRWKIPEARTEEILDAITSDKKSWVDLMMTEELGIIETEVDSAAKHGAVTTAAFILSGFLPLIPYLWGVSAESQFTVSLSATALSLFLVGAMRTFITGGRWFRSGIEMFLVGSLAALSAYLVGGVVKTIFGISVL